MQKLKKTFKFGNHEVTLETGQIARQADAAVMVTMAEIEQAAGEGRARDLLLPMDAGLLSWPARLLDAEMARRFCHGNAVPGGDGLGKFRVFGPEGILGLGEALQDGTLQPMRIFVTGPGLESVG